MIVNRSDKLGFKLVIIYFLLSFFGIAAAYLPPFFDEPILLSLSCCPCLSHVLSGVILQVQGKEED